MEKMEKLLGVDRAQVRRAMMTKNRSDATGEK